MATPNNLAADYLETGRLDEAEALRRRAERDRGLPSRASRSRLC